MVNIKHEVPKHFMCWLTSHHTKYTPMTKSTLSQQQQQKQLVKPTPEVQSLAIAPILPFGVGRMGILSCLPNFCVFIFCFIICAFACVKELLCIHHHLHHIWQLSNAFQPFFRYMVNLVVVTTIVLDYLVEATW